MTYFNKPRLVNKHFLHKLQSHNLKKKYISWDKTWNFIYNNIIIILILGIIIFGLYYRYHLKQNNNQNTQNIQNNNQNIPQNFFFNQQNIPQNISQNIPQSYSNEHVVGPQSQFQTPYFDPATGQPIQGQYYSNMKNPVSPPNNQYHQDYQQKVSNDYNDNDLVNDDSTQPINLIQNNYYSNQNNTHQNKIINENDYSLKTRSASFLTPHYIGPNFAPAK